MQTFLPYHSFVYSARCLDNRRLGKQRVEAKQILLALGVDVGQHRGNPGSRWRHHPAVGMWRGSENWLAMYAAEVCQEWIRRGFKDTLRVQFLEVFDRFILEGRVLDGRPIWLGDDEVHRSHRSNLLRKMPQHYGQFCWDVPNDLPYVWPEGVCAQ